MDDILLEESKPDGFGRSAEPVATQPQQQAAEAQNWAAMQQRMQVRLSHVAPCIQALAARMAEQAHDQGVALGSPLQQAANTASSSKSIVLSTGRHAS